MSSLQFAERNLLESILEMRTGYVSNFSDRTFQEFVLEKTGIDILTDSYAENGTSKANRLRTFWRKESDPTVVALIEPLLEYAFNEKTGFGKEATAENESLFAAARKVVQRLKVEPATSTPDIQDLETESKSYTFKSPSRFIEIILNIILVPIYLIFQFTKDVVKYAYQHLVQVLGIALAVVILHLIGVI